MSYGENLGSSALYNDSHETVNTFKFWYNNFANVLLSLEIAGCMGDIMMKNGRMYVDIWAFFHRYIIIPICKPIIQKYFQ